MGKNLQDNTGPTLELLQKSNSEEELTKFIQANATETPFTSETLVFEPFKASEDLNRYKAFLAEQTQELKKDQDSKM